ncbi:MULTISPECIES: hypothetical protein [Tenacibaculum]|uniref:hypothetical protein n=1 Tax=Tenacibaculum TaxID=104267 RepID=UPI001F0B3684|nr:MULTISPECIES: hypothetical protein [Tenacibaculum]MCH3880997.1 hypothetical protein [Tenacibaculum aquimarinum]MDO6599403.1 hypothetical protein [Tenacibaculum sp. 1_MG-2023]
MLKKKPYLLFFYSIPLILLFGFIFNNDADINIHDTYFITTVFHLSILLSFVVFLFGFTYWLIFHFKRKTYYNLPFISYLLLLVPILLLWILPNFINTDFKNIENYINNRTYFNRVENFYSTLLLLCCSSFVILIFNIGIAFFKKKKSV